MSSSVKVDEAKSTDDPFPSKTKTNEKSHYFSAPIVEPPEKEKQPHNGNSSTSKHDHQRPRKQKPPMEDSPSQDGKNQNQNQKPPDWNVEQEQPDKDKQPFNGAIPSKHDQQRKQYHTVEDTASQDRDNNQNQPSPPPQSVEQPEKDRQRQIPSKQHRPPSKDPKNHSQNQPPQPPARNVEQPENDRRPFNGVNLSKQDHLSKQYLPMEDFPSKELKKQSQSNPPPPPARNVEQPVNDIRSLNGVTPSKQDYLSKQYLPMEDYPSKELKKQSNPPTLPARNVEQPENDRQPATTVTYLKHDHPPKQYLPMADSPSKELKQQTHPPPQHLQAYIPADYVIQPDGPPADTQPHPSLDPPERAETDKSRCCCIL